MFDFLDKRLKNNVYLGLCFVVLFSAFNALISVQWISRIHFVLSTRSLRIKKTITTNIQLDDPTYTADGYISLGIVYTALSISMWLSPGVIAKLGPKYTMIMGACFYAFYIASFYTEKNIWVYIGSALCGIGASLLWTGQANYIVLNAEVGKVYAGIGMFWMLYEASHLFGNIIVYFEFNDINRAIDKPMRIRIVTTFLGFILAGVLMMLGIKTPIRKEEDTAKRNPCTEIVKSSKILLSPHMLLLCITMICTGFHLTFLSILSASMGFSKYLSDNSKELAPLCGLLQGFGEMFGGFLSIFLGGTTICKTKPLLTIACALNILAYTITLLVLPTNSANFYTNDLPIVPLPTVFIIVASIFVGVGDACLHTELYDYIGAMYPNDSASAFAVFKFIRSLATAGSFYYGRVLGLHTQIIILLALTFLSWITYHYIQWFMIKSPLTTDQNERKEINQS